MEGIDSKRHNWLIGYLIELIIKYTHKILDQVDGIFLEVLNTN
jgi:hypothetical protein